MSYNKTVLAGVLKEYEGRRVLNLTERDSRREEIYSKLPRIKEIDGQLAEVGISLSRLALLGSIDGESAIEKIKSQSEALINEKKQLLNKNGYDSNYLTEQFRCSECKDTGYKDHQLCYCLQKRLKQEAYKLSNLSQQLDTQNFDSFNPSYYSTQRDSQSGIIPLEQIQHILKESIDFVNNFEAVEQKNLFMCGNTGLGKTFLSSCIAKELLDKGYCVIYQSANRIFNMLQDDRFNTGGDNNKHIINSLYDCDLLIIDDLGTELVTSYTASAFFDILNTRLINNKKMIINTNLSLERINTVYSPRIASRLMDFLQMVFIGEDIRKQRFER